MYFFRYINMPWDEPGWYGSCGMVWLCKEYAQTDEKVVFHCCYFLYHNPAEFLISKATSCFIFVLYLHWDSRGGGVGSCIKHWDIFGISTVLKIKSIEGLRISIMSNAKIW